MNKNRIKSIVKKRFSYLLPLALFPEYLMDYFRYVRFSGMMDTTKGQNHLMGRIIQSYHVLEKGLTMPESRLGFGRDRIIAVVDACLEYVEAYGDDDEQLQHAVSVVFEYRDVHKENNYVLCQQILDKIRLLENRFNFESSSQAFVSRKLYFEHTDADFRLFSESRSSVRNYSPQEVPIEVIKSSIELARNAPSSCNRQGSRTHVFSDPEQIKKIMSIQTGNRGFGHLANKVILVTGELALNHNVYERNQVYVDGGMFAMNILYALHYHKVAACPLNCYLPYRLERQLGKECKLPNSEAVIMIISCGYPPDKFKIARSPRYSVEKVMTVN